MSCPTTRFPGVRLKPLGHLSKELPGRNLQRRPRLLHRHWSQLVVAVRSSSSRVLRPPPRGLERLAQLPHMALYQRGCSPCYFAEWFVTSHAALSLMRKATLLDAEIRGLDDVRETRRRTCFWIRTPVTGDSSLAFRQFTRQGRKTRKTTG